MYKLSEQIKISNTSITNDNLLEHYLCITGTHILNQNMKIIPKARTQTTTKVHMINYVSKNNFCAHLVSTTALWSHARLEEMMAWGVVERENLRRTQHVPFNMHVLLTLTASYEVQLWKCMCCSPSLRGARSNTTNACERASIVRSWTQQNKHRLHLD